MRTLTTEELSELLEAGPAAVFDVRGDIQYEKSHIPGARTAPLGSLTFRIASVMNPGSRVIVYSDGGRCRLAAEAVERLEMLGLRNVFCYEEGVKGWKATGHSLVRSAGAKTHTWGPVIDCRSIVVDRERAYNGAFMSISSDVEGAGG